MDREELVKINESLFKTHIIQPTELQNIIEEYKTIAKLDKEKDYVLPSLPEMLEVVNAFHNICILSKNNKVYKVF